MKLLSVTVLAVVFAGCNQGQSPPSETPAKRSYAEALQIYTAEQAELDRLVDVKTKEAGEFWKPQDEVQKDLFGRPYCAEKKAQILDNLTAADTRHIAFRGRQAAQEKQIATQTKRVEAAKAERDALRSSQ